MAAPKAHGRPALAPGPAVPASRVSGANGGERRERTQIRHPNLPRVCSGRNLLRPTHNTSDLDGPILGGTPPAVPALDGLGALVASMLLWIAFALRLRETARPRTQSMPTITMSRSVADPKGRGSNRRP